MSVLPVTRLEELLEELARERGGALTVLEVGCGRYRHFALPDGARVSGLDISCVQLENNDHADERILGDAQTWQTDRQWDVVVSIFLLEHVDDPGRALANMLGWTRPGGLLVVAVPNVLSLKGLITKATPFAFHDWVYRYVYRRPYRIFPTTMRLAIAPWRMRRQLADHRIVLELFSPEEIRGVFGVLYALAIAALKGLSLGRWRPEDSNYLLVAQRAPAPAKDQARGQREADPR